MSMGLHARYVVLDAEGIIQKRSRKKVEKKAARKAVSEKPAEKSGQAATGSPAKSGSTGSACDATDSDQDTDEGDEDEPDDTWVAVDPPHGRAQPVLKRVTPAATSPAPAVAEKAAVPETESSSVSASDVSKLSKADRKALKKKLLDERIKREQRKAANW